MVCGKMVGDCVWIRFWVVMVVVVILVRCWLCGFIFGLWNNFCFVVFCMVKLFVV